MAVIYHISPKRAGHAFVGNMVKSWTGCEYHDNEGLLPCRALWVPKDAVILLQTRDLFNWWASYTKHKQGLNSTPKNGVFRKWLHITREFYGVTNYLKDYKVIRILYDSFASSRAYRKDICGMLDGDYNEDYLNIVPYNGGGSSFDGLKFNGMAHKMDILKRYHQVPASCFNSIRHDKEAMKLQKYICNSQY